MLFRSRAEDHYDLSSSVLSRLFVLPKNRGRGKKAERLVSFATLDTSTSNQFQNVLRYLKKSNGLYSVGRIRKLTKQLSTAPTTIKQLFKPFLQKIYKDPVLTESQSNELSRLFNAVYGGKRVSNVVDIDSAWHRIVDQMENTLVTAEGEINFSEARALVKFVQDEPGSLDMVLYAIRQMPLYQSSFGHPLWEVEAVLTGQHSGIVSGEIIGNMLVTLDGHHYQIEDELNSGGFGVVYKGTDLGPVNTIGEPQQLAQKIGRAHV